MKSNLTSYYGWADIDSDCNMLAGLVSPFTEKDTRVIAFKNDIIPATLIANRLGVDIIQINDINNVPMIANSLTSGSVESLSYPNLILVASYIADDSPILDTIFAEYCKAGHKVKTISLYCATNGVANFYQHFVEYGTNIIFPWKT